MNNKKYLKEVLKEKLSSDEEFKEFYNSLSDEEKEELKERTLTRKSLVDDIFDNHKESWDYLEIFAIKSLTKKILSKGYKKPHGKKARGYVFGRTFVFQKGNYHIALASFPDKKRSEYTMTSLLEISSEKGNIYVVITGSLYEINESSHITVYTSHFFDRYSKRLGKKENRNQAIARYLREYNKLEGVGINEDQANGNTIQYLKSGLALGTNLSGILFIKTFISNDQLNDYQKNIKEKLKEITEK